MHLKTVTVMDWTTGISSSINQGERFFFCFSFFHMIYELAHV